MKTKISASMFALLLVVPGVAFGQIVTPEPRGLRVKCDAVSPGYTLFAPMSSDTTYLIDLDGRAVRTWRSAFLPSAWVYLLDNGHVLRGGSDRGSSVFSGGGQGGRFQEFDLDGNLVWDFRYNETRLPHHDVAVLPNGNILAIVWEAKTAVEARRAGRRPTSIPSNGVWPDMLIEFEPQRPNGARIVWEWHMWDHLIQNIDPALENYADPATHPERININGSTSGGGAFLRDMFHTNAVDYNPELDQIILSVPTFDEVWVIDHSTTTQEAAGRTGGRSGKGGDLLYRWGNPQAYGRGTAEDQLLGFQHDVRWIPQGRPGAGHITVFSNRTPGPNGEYTKVYEFAPPVDSEGHYAVPDIGPFGPATPLWTYSNESLDTINLSGAERLENGNTLISDGPEGRLFEITPNGNIVWDYRAPYSGLSGSNGNAFSLFRAVKIRPEHPGFLGRDLRPMDPQPPISPSASVGTGSVEHCLSAPTLSTIHPSSAVQGTSIDVALSGTHFVSPALAANGGGIEITNLKVNSEESLTATFAIASDAAVGVRDVTITTAGGTATTGFTVLPPPPTLTKITPGVGARATGGLLEVTLTGTNFVPGMTLDAGSHITVSDIQVISSTEATARLLVAPGASLGPVNVRVTTTGGTSATVPFIIADPFPDLTVASSHSGNFGVGFDETYAVTVRNVGLAATGGTITVTDSLPVGFTFVSGTGPGWTCSASGQIVTCTTATVLAANDWSRYTLTVAVNGNAAPSVNHSAAVVADSDLNAANNVTEDVTTVVTPSPAFVFTPSSLVPGQQATVDVTMPPFPHDVTGSILLTFHSNATIPVDDPAIQFSSGGRIATFMIPANETRARFGSESGPGPLSFQSGTVAGAITFSGDLRAGKFQKSFSRSGAEALTIPLQALSIQSVQTSTQGGFSVSLLLFATAREVTQLSLSFSTSPEVRLSCGTTTGCSTSGKTLSLDVGPLFNHWFNSDTTSGGLALLRFPLNIAGAVKGTVAVTLRNSKGQSNSQSFALP
ncbi:MAG TPA: aryl-sulfate sulfotransferase [Terriglobia bacterium]|nr:aryl-sulfate sulfotransferase [Terriglobia bacterium]